ncbi:hypothetical protein SSYRP_v1c06110 [Spiroplasma syrphidicola EA-1]|uniref:Uncharacterized protein n=1 Tax=Spiroplasma syrphidicola EA-1 TaxID=1276229 RepID=R4ULW0_9MOLU|nr:hypothetical protein [Spiroplasma syrphidicola]AGM26201.1 hypothetical protein SSYRP_v1c06110 [Spiroplasma syrphidicola EA-1]
MTNFSKKLSEPEIRMIWDNTQQGGGRNNLLFRRDIAGAFIKIGELNQESEFGWVIDLLVPLDKGGKLEVNNCLAMHWKNSKARRGTLNDWKAAVEGKVQSENKREFQKPTNVKTNKIIKGSGMKVHEVSPIWNKY